MSSHSHPWSSLLHQFFIHVPPKASTIFMWLLKAVSLPFSPLELKPCLTQDVVTQAHVRTWYYDFKE